MKLNKILLGLSLIAIASSAQAGITVFDGNNGGTGNIDAALKGSANVETGTGQVNNGNEPAGDPLTFNGDVVSFDVSAGLSQTTNLAFAAFNVSDIDTSYRAYQDLNPQHGGLGAVNANDFSGDNLRPGNGNVNKDEVLFFDFDSMVTLTKVWFNGAHQELTTVDANNPNGGTTDYFNIFTSIDGLAYTSIFGGQQKPTNKEYLETNLTDTFRYYAIAASGWGDSNGGYVEAIEIDALSVVEASSPSTVIMLGLSLFGMGALSRKRN